jgi:hypothetical protein
MFDKALKDVISRLSRVKRKGKRALTNEQTTESEIDKPWDLVQEITNSAEDLGYVLSQLVAIRLGIASDA